MRKKVYLFDFDGTLTSADTLLHFIRYACGTWHFFLGFLLYSPLLVLMKLGLCPNYMVKQRVFSWFFRGMSYADFDSLCRHFAADNMSLLRPKAVDMLHQLFARGENVMIVSASIDNWVRPFVEPFAESASATFHVAGTQVEVADGKLTGRFSSKNCYGEEKVNRIKAIYPNRKEWYMVAFGDSRGDRAMLNYADEQHFKPFRTTKDASVSDL